MTLVTALVKVTDRCQVLMSPEPDPREGRLTGVFMDLVPLHKVNCRQTDTERPADGVNTRYTVAVDAELFVCKLEDQGSSARLSASSVDSTGATLGSEK